jgi:hypothetical protein
MSTQAPIESDLIVRCCNKERKGWHQWLERKNAEYEKEFAARVERWENGGWFYRLMFSHPKKYDSIDDMGPHMRKLHYEDMIDKINNLQALANKSVDGIVMLSPEDAQFLHIDDN